MQEPDPLHHVQGDLQPLPQRQARLRTAAASDWRTFMSQEVTAQSGRHLQARVEVPVQPLHDEQYGDAGAAPVAVVDHGAVQVHQPLVFRQRPESQTTSIQFLTFNNIQRYSTERRVESAVKSVRRTWCSGTPEPSRSSVCRRVEPQTSGRRDSVRPSSHTDTPPRTGLGPTPGPASVCL